MPESDLIVHDYAGKAEEQGVLEKLAAARCKVSSLSEGRGIAIVFFKNKTIPKAVLEILDPESRESMDLIELSRPMEEYRVESLAMIGEVDAPKVAIALGKESAISELQSLGCNVGSSNAHSKISVYNPNTRFGIVIKFTSGPDIEIPSRQSAEDIFSTRITSIRRKYPEED